MMMKRRIIVYEDQAYDKQDDRRHHDTHPAPDKQIL